MINNWEKFLRPYEQAVAELKVKFKALREEYIIKGAETPIEFVTGRVKSVDAIQEKLVRRHVDEERLEQDMQDLAGIRIMTQFTNDIYTVVDLIRDRNDMVVLEERDYVTNSKPSGYRSYHIVVEYPLETIDGERKILVEIQIRTMQMNVWATIEHAINYKYEGEYPEDMEGKLREVAELTFKVDELFQEMHQEISDSQQALRNHTKRETLSDENFDLSE
ncbi:GTP pyrophosphokinase family protein [Weissella koreensis]|uniref:GTP pyrophosphokinase family protein n=1 Tax=Weissella koreensis TaxID=165096 RepID=A0A7H1MKP4_9LACO|nr:GTP pyrophosphokinase family protein [Weissella koreensis]AEJ23183.1 GTP diphosphokinase [Weissella koreensis KACC 15510]AVH74827.1 GTP pyrophosphokinase family protein [Weissella koreensis]EJF33784.1 GTP diphosphokinase [Weissella koreensis KCTC 3621]QGN20051.1 GTP pyrophosphokinase [Weissella koreensis]QNT64030.1 GTP pyrophosphokinase family protein [Weissella koreensis]